MNNVIIIQLPENPICDLVCPTGERNQNLESSDWSCHQWGKLQGNHLISCSIPDSKREAMNESDPGATGGATGMRKSKAFKCYFCSLFPNCIPNKCVDDVNFADVWYHAWERNGQEKNDNFDSTCPCLGSKPAAVDEPVICKEILTFHDSSEGWIQGIFLNY